MKAYFCNVDFDNGTVKGELPLLVFARDPEHAAELCEKKLCRHSDDIVKVNVIIKTDVAVGDAFLLNRRGGF